ncbi:LuxR C-terminal-related transcriptional regulator [Jeotgalibacillus soli]|uniref:HTH luxR-type domain-containing protein n=1 Tax=Jeotgalibacillus soli TaxID=889306 RepID=A0A0C2RVF4_9BACL|nr:LuxR C-terminal-related transcriptional regulator [Jeotgalibacillus soli]KIL45744.1 hypothetical protein KP78_20930 [Jeotgalibacillus soli]
MNRQQIESALKDYRWMMNSILLLEEELKHPNAKVTALYGIEAAMPKAQGGPSDPVLQEVCRREKKWNRLDNYREKCAFITSRMHLITNDREIEVLNLTMDGLSNRKIAAHMGFSHTHIKRIQESIVAKLVDKREHVA